MKKSTILVTGLCLASLGAWAAPAPKPVWSGNKAVVQKIYDAFNSNDPTALEKVVAENAVVHDLPAGKVSGLQKVEEEVVLLTRAFPDFKILVEDMVAEGDRVAARIMVMGTQEGEFLGIPRTGRQVAYTGIQYFRCVGGKAVEMWSFMDHERLRRQLTPAPAPNAGK